MWTLFVVVAVIMLGMLWAVGADGNRDYPAKGEDTFPPDF